MVGQRLPPGVQDREAADLRSEPARIGGQRGHGLDGALEQDRLDDGLVLEGDGGDWWGKREDDVEIRNRQQFGSSIRQPMFSRGSLTLRANADCDMSCRRRAWRRNRRKPRHGRRGPPFGTP